MKRYLACLVVTAFAAATPAAAYAADTFTVSVTPTTAGTADAPTAEEIKTDLKIESNAVGTPHDAVTSYASLMPAEFADNTGKFATCDRQKIHAAGTGGPHAPPDCPPDSVLGSGVLESVIPQLAIDSTTDKLVVYNSGGGNLTVWMHISKPTEVTFTFDGVISRGSAPFGPVVTWDFGPAANGQIANVDVYVKRFQTTWAPRGAASAPTGGAAQSNAAKRSACIKKAKKRYKHDKKKRSRAIKKCKKRFPTRSSRAVTRAEAASQISPFESTGCARGKWQFEAQVKFKNGAPDDKLDQEVACAPAGGTPSGGGGGVTGGGGCGLPICPTPSRRE